MVTSQLILAAVTLPFNLVCTGTTISGLAEPGHFGLTDMKQATFTDVLRVDLASRRWCRGECETTQPINELSDTRIRFEMLSEPIETITEVSRESAQYVHRERAARFVSMRSGQCEKAAFTGFPPRKF